MVPNEKVFCSALAHGAVGYVGCSLPLGAALHSGITGSFCFSAVPLHKVGSWWWGCLWCSPPPPRPPRIRTSVRLVDAIVIWVDGERKDTPTTGSTRWRAHWGRRRRRFRIRNGWRRRWRGQDHRSGLCRRGVPVVPRIDPRCNGGVMRSGRLHCAKALSRVAVGHFEMIRHASLHRFGILLVALNRRVKLSKRRRNLGHPAPVGLTDAKGRGYCLRKLPLGSLQL